MHPCCWGNLLQGFVQLVPVLAIVLVAGKKIFEAMRAFLPMLKRRAAKPCCCPSNSESAETVTAVEIGLRRAK